MHLNITVHSNIKRSETPILLRSSARGEEDEPVTMTQQV
jgi:hypothetical protein